MDLSDLKTKFTELLNIKNVEEAPHRIMEVLFSCKNEVFEKWLSDCSDLTKDYLQIIFQYYMADRKEKMQDYTPVTLAKACVKVAGIENAKSCYDMCAGSGALTIQAWNINKDCEYICEEFDERVIPFLLFNLAIQNINGVVINGDVLSGERFKAWRLSASDKFSEIEEIIPPEELKTEVCISNPPYNMKWKQEAFINLDKRFVNYDVPPKGNANFAFILSGVAVARRTALILPGSVISKSGSKEEKNIRQILVEKNKIDAIIINPDNMFEATSIGTCLMVFDNEKSTTYTEFVDMRETYAEEKRYQHGQVGSKSHTNRVYEKSVKIYTDEHIEKMFNAVRDKAKQENFSKAATTEDIKNNRYNLNPSEYIEDIFEEPQHRSYNDILNDINRIATEKNCCKLIINETLAKRLGFDKTLYEQEPLQDKNFFALMEKLTGEKPIKSDYIRFTKNKNELTFTNNNSEFVSTVLTMILQMWKQHIAFLNNEENRYLVEMRDALLPDLMSGKIEV